MTRQSTDTCASCSKYPLHAAVKGGGAATCTEFERTQAWHDRACVLHMPANDRASRAALVKQLRVLQPQEKETKE